MFQLKAILLLLAAAAVCGFLNRGPPKAVAKKKPALPDYLREPAPGKGNPGSYFINEDDSLSEALPWVSKPLIGDGTLAGDYGFDPWGLANTFDISWLRSSELKHGRVCMLAILGLVTPELVQHPPGFEGWKFAAEFTQMNGIKALSSVPKFGIAQIVFVCGLIEVFTLSSNYNAKFTFDDNLSPLEKEYSQGKKAEFLTGAAKTAAKTYTASKKTSEVFVPESKRAGDLGFDPLGFAAAGIRPDYEISEILHGRIAMIATLGALIQTYIDPNKGLLESTSDWIKTQS